MESNLAIEKKKFYFSIAEALIVALIVWLAFILNNTFSLHWNQYGMQPRTLEGLLGILTMPFLHSDFTHLSSNTFPLLFLSFGLFYFFPKKATIILIMLSITTGILAWVIGRDGTHIGASGVVYALAFFLVTISLIKRENSLLAYTLVIIFLHGSLIWGFFPQLFPDKHISWEGHLSGAITGIILAFYYRQEGPQRKEYFQDEEDEPDNDFESEYYSSNSFPD